MKKRTLTAIVAIFITIGTYYFTSCQKEMTTNETETICSTCQEGKELGLKINSFNALLSEAKAGSKNKGTMKLDEALKNMELLVNASHGFPFDPYSQRVVEEVEFTLEADEEGNATLNNISIAYEQMIEKVREAYINNEFENKGLVMVQLEKNDNKNEQTITAKAVIGRRGELNTNNFTNCWFYGENLGMCNGTLMGIMDGGDTLANVLNANNPIHEISDCPGSDYHLILDTLDEITLQGNEYSINGEYLMFYYPDDGSGFSNEEMQLSAEEMNQYYDNEYYLLYTLIHEIYDIPFPAYCLVNCSIDGYPYILNIDEALRHQNKLTYAKRNWVHNDVIPSPSPIN